MSTPDTFHEFCKKQILRFGGQPGFPDPKLYPQSVADLVDALEHRLSKGSRDFAKRLVDVSKESSAYCPSVADLINLATSLRETDKAHAPNNQRADWERDFGKPQRIAPDFTVPQKRRVDELWDKLKLKYPDRKWPSWKTLAVDARELGYEDYAQAWERD